MKKTYINLINEFWIIYEREGLGMRVQSVYFCLLNLINRARWQPVAVSLRKLAETLGMGRNTVRSSIARLIEHGLIISRRNVDNCNSTTIFSLPQVEAVQHVQDSAVNVPVENKHIQDQAVNGPVENKSVQDSSVNVFAAKETVENKAVKDMSVEKMPEVSAPVDNMPVGDYMRREKKRAMEQGEKVLRSVLDPFCQKSMEAQLMQNRINAATYRMLAEEVVADWIECGECHDDARGNFDIKGAIRHLQRTLRIKANDLHRREREPKSRREKNTELIQAAMNDLYSVCGGTQRHSQDLLPPPF